MACAIEHQSTGPARARMSRAASRRILAPSLGLVTALLLTTARGQQIATPSPPTDRHWDGLNPFEAPSLTTDYYGSGDIDLDGSITSEDVRMLEEIIAGTRPPNVRADIDGNGVIDGADLALLEAALEGGTLPAWWNRLNSPGDRADWVQRVAAIDFNQLINNGEADSDWVCTDYATRCFLRFAPQVLDAANPLYASFGIAQDTFNLPLYIATVTTPDFGHSLNAILIGDDPTLFTNWFFLEPETGTAAQPGDWDLPWNAEVQIQLPALLNAPYYAAASLVDFLLAQPAPLTLDFSSALVRERPPANAAPIHNNPNTWQAVVLPEGGGMLLFDKSRDDLLRSTDLHLLGSLDGDPNTAQPLLDTGGFNRLVSTARASAGNYHLLWVGHTNRQQELFYGKLATATALISEAWVVATNVLQGRVLGIGSNEAFVFYPTAAGLVCLHKEGDQWGAPETVLQWTTLPVKIGFPCFAVTLATNGAPCVIWSDETTRENGPYQTTIFEAGRGNGWQTPQTVAVLDGFVTSLELARDGAGTIHLVYANTWFPAFDCDSGASPGELWQVVRGAIIYSRCDSTGWSGARTVATNGFWPAITVTRSGEVILAWETDLDGQVAPVWTDETAGTAPQSFSTQGTPYYPAITEVATGAILLSWSEASQWGYTANYGVIQEPEKIRVGIAASAAGVQVTWTARTAGAFQVESTDSPSQTSWQPLGASIVTQTNCGSLCLPVDPAKPVCLYRVKRL
jgi:hypothetical protein